MDIILLCRIFFFIVWFGCGQRISIVDFIAIFCFCISSCALLFQGIVIFHLISALTLLMFSLQRLASQISVIEHRKIEIRKIERQKETSLNNEIIKVEQKKRGDTVIKHGKHRSQSMVSSFHVFILRQWHNAYGGQQCQQPCIIVATLFHNINNNRWQ